MILHDQLYETLAYAPIKTTDTVVARQTTDPYGYYDDTLIWTSSDLLMQVNVDAVGSFLGTATKKATVKLLGIVDTAAVDDIFQIRTGIYNNDPSVAGFDYISQGFFVVDSIAYDYDAGSTTVTMYDWMYTAQNLNYTDTNQSSGFSYPTTIEGLASQMAAAIGVDLMSNFWKLPNSTYAVATDPYNNISNATLQTVIQDIASATGTTARITDTTLVFVPYYQSAVPFADDFDSFNADHWLGGAYNTAQITYGGQLHIALPSGSTNYHGLVSGYYNFTGQQVSMKLVDAGNQSLASLEVLPVQVRSSDATNSLSWVVSGNTKVAYKKVSSTQTNVYSSAYSPSSDVYFRIRERNGITYWETSADGDTWVTNHSEANPIDVTSLAFELSAGTWSSEASSSSIILDKFNMLPMMRAGELADIDTWIVPQENLDSDTLRTLKIGKQYGPITSVVLGRVPQNDNIVIANKAPEVNTISSIDTGTNLITITANAMVDGNLVRISSTGTYPAPLQPDTNYYIFTNGDPDTFALAYNYNDAIAGTGLIDLTSSGSGTITISHIETQEAQINNNQLVDGDRATALPEIYASLVGAQWNSVTAETIGLGWHEIGDIVQFTQGASTVNGFISEVHLTLAGSIKESLVSITPDAATINYQTAGGILKTLYNTEIQVDKQNNDITSIVEEQTTFESTTNSNFTEVYQNLTDILLTVQKSGGGNLILNSVGYATEGATDGGSIAYDALSFWTYNAGYTISTDGTVKSYSSSESQNNGGVSGQVIEMAGSDVSITQRVNVATNTSLSFALRVKNQMGTGAATITLSNDNDTFTLNVSNSSTYDWEELKIENFVSSMSWLDITIQVSSATQFVFTDLRLLYGSTLQGWVQSASEILSTNVQFTKNGMKIFDNVHDTETQVTYNEFSTRRKTDNAVLFEADDSGIITNDLKVRGVTTYESGGTGVIKQVTIPSSSALAGVAWIKVV